MCLIFGYWIVQMTLAPVAVPPSAPARKNVTFDARLDISKNATFTQLKSIGPMEVDVPPTGRDNPFAPVTAQVAATGEAPVVTTSTATSTLAAPSSTQPF